MACFGREAGWFQIAALAFLNRFNQHYAALVYVLVWLKSQSKLSV
jgi:hypothetical protein